MPRRRPRRAWVLGAVGVVVLAGCTTTPQSRSSTAPTPTAASTDPAPSSAFDPRTYDYTSLGKASGSGAVLQGSTVLTHAGDVLRGISVSADQGATIGVRNAVDAGVADAALETSIWANAESSPARVVVTDSTVDGGSKAALGGAAVNVTRSKITSLVDGIEPTGGAHNPQSIVQYNLIEANGDRNTPGKHNDGIQIWQGGNILIDRNWITGWSTSAIMIKSDREQVEGDGPISHVTVSQNYLAAPTADYSLYVVDGGKGAPEYVTVTGNVFGPCRAGHERNACMYPSAKKATFVRTEAERDRAVAAGVANAAAWIVWSDNVSAATGEELSPPGGWTSYP